eukprot:jgi/Chrzof1/1625/Cz10g14300.t1
MQTTIHRGVLHPLTCSSSAQARQLVVRPTCPCAFRCLQPSTRNLTPLLQLVPVYSTCRPVVVQRAYEQGNGFSGKDPSLEEYVEVKVDSVKFGQGAAIVYLRVLDSNGLMIPMHIGETESNALLQEINKKKQLRPLTHDMMKNVMQAIGYKVTKILVTDVISNTYIARIHLGTVNPQGAMEEVNVDARPSDAINLAIRFGAPMYLNKKIAENIAPQPLEPYNTGNESNSDIVRSVRETLASYEDPTIMFQLQKELAVKEERFEDAQMFQQYIAHEMTHNQLLRVVVAMEYALSDGRYDEAARLRDEYKKMVSQKVADRRQ